MPIPLSDCSILQQLDDRFGQQHRSTRRDEKPGFPVVNHLWQAPDLGRHDRSAGRPHAMASRADVPSPSLTELITKTSNPLCSESTSERNPARTTCFSKFDCLM